MWQDGRCITLLTATHAERALVGSNPTIIWMQVNVSNKMVAECSFIFTQKKSYFITFKTHVLWAYAICTVDIYLMFFYKYLMLIRHCNFLFRVLQNFLATITARVIIRFKILFNKQKKNFILCVCQQLFFKFKAD